MYVTHPPFINLWIPTAHGYLLGTPRYFSGWLGQAYNSYSLPHCTMLQSPSLQKTTTKNRPLSAYFRLREGTGVAVVHSMTSSPLVLPSSAPPTSPGCSCDRLPPLIRLLAPPQGEGRSAKDCLVPKLQPRQESAVYALREDVDLIHVHRTSLNVSV